MAYHADCAGLSHRGFTKAEIDAAGFPAHTRRMAKKSAAKVEQASSLSPKSKKNETGKMPVPRASALLDIRVVYCGDNLEQLAKLSVCKCIGQSVVFRDPEYLCARNVLRQPDTKENRSLSP